MEHKPSLEARRRAVLRFSAAVAALICLASALFAYVNSTLVSYYFPGDDLAWHYVETGFFVAGACILGLYAIMGKLLPGQGRQENRSSRKERRNTRRGDSAP